MNKEKSIVGNIFHKNGRALGSMGYFILLMLVFLIGAPEAWMRPSLHQSVFVMLPTLIFLVIPLVFLVASGEIDLSFASTYADRPYVEANERSISPEVTKNTNGITINNSVGIMTKTD